MQIPDFQEEALLWEQGNAFVFGLDEAGRGCLAGPVCAAAAAWPVRIDAQSLKKLLVRDSKQMSEAQREAAFGVIQERSLACGVGWASSKEIDRWNILRATYLATARAVEQSLQEMVELGVLQKKEIATAQFAFLTDGSHPLLSQARGFVLSQEYMEEFPLLSILFARGIREKCIIKGDSKVYSIASASVLAKVTRDHHMLELDREFPAYEFAAHKGYCTAKHIERLRKVGPCSEHRMSYSPVAEAARLFGMA